VCGTKNFVSVRLYSAPQSHRTIVAIFGICAFGEPVQVGSFAAIKVTPYPDSVLNIVRTEVPAEPGDVCLVK